METDDNSALDGPDLVRLLVLEAGRLMEEASPMLAMRLPDDRAARAAVLVVMNQASETIDALLHAASALHRMDDAAQDMGI